MKKILLAILIFSILFIQESRAQFVKIRLNHPNASIALSMGHPPFPGAVWIGPEWEWAHGEYVSIPGRWVRPHRNGMVWVPGQWKKFRRGFRWIPGHWI